MATGKCLIMYVAHIIFLLDSADIDDSKLPFTEMRSGFPALAGKKLGRK